jgi:hypothetical protein
MDDDRGPVFFPTRDAAEAARNSVASVYADDSELKWRVIEKRGKIFVAAFIGRDLIDIL